MIQQARQPDLPPHLPALPGSSALHPHPLPQLALLDLPRHRHLPRSHRLHRALQIGNEPLELRRL